MNPRYKKILLLLMAVLLLFGTSRVQNSMNRDRETLGLTRVQPLDNAPPVLAFTTVALGGFRGLISNLLWMRATALQEQDKYFEMVQLADWITKLEPHFTQVWAFQAWNMGWNISVKFKDYEDRWRWLHRGMELLRDDALRYNPDNLLLHRELAWIFQDKMGKSTDDASLFYKHQWAKEMSEVFSQARPNFDELIHPQTDQARQRARLLREKYKLDPVVMKKVDHDFGPLEWRLPEAHAIYWAALGMQKARNFPGRINPKDIITLRRVIYQSMLLSFQRGRLETSPLGIDFGPNLDIIPRVNKAYEDNWAEDDVYRPDIKKAHRNFLRQAVYFLYVNNRLADAAKWYQYLADNYPDQRVIDTDPNSFPHTLSLSQYAVGRVQEDINETSPYRMRSNIEGLLFQSYRSLVFDEDERAIGFRNLARQAYDAYERKIPQGREQAMGLGPFDEIDKIVRNQLLTDTENVAPELRAILFTKLGLSAESTTNNIQTRPPLP